MATAWAESIFGPVPADIDLSESSIAGNNVAAVILTAIATGAVALRLWSRLRQGSLTEELKWDDLWICVALVFVYVTTSLSIAGGYFGAGKHVWLTDAQDVLVIMKILYGYTWIYGLSNAMTKISVLCFYRRIFATAGDKLFDYITYLLFFISVAYPIMIITVMLGACKPLDYYWLKYSDATATGTCLEVNKFFLIAGIINMIVDIVILSIPIPKIIKLQMSRRKKNTVIGIMLLGGFVCVASIIRIYYLVTLQTAIDLTWIMGPIFIWSCLEPSIGILSACLPVMGPLLRAHYRNHWASSDKSTQDSDPYRHGAPRSKNWLSFSSSKRKQRQRMADDELELTTANATFVGQTMSEHTKESSENVGLANTKSAVAMVQTEVNRVQPV